jgi:Flp pilus assembly protein TadG
MMSKTRSMAGLTNRRRQSSRGSRRGATATEFAIIFPVLMTIVLACIDLGRFGYMYIAVTNAARAGAGYGSVQRVTTTTLPAWRSAIRTTCTNEISGATGFDAKALSIPDPVLITEQGGLKRVQVRVDYQFSMLVNWPFLPNQMALSRTVEMRMVR